MRRHFCQTIGRRFALFLLSFFAFYPAATAISKEPQSVLILPFEIQGAEELSYLSSDIPASIGQHLKKEGADLLTAKTATEEFLKTMAKVPSAIRELGSQEGADIVIWGKLAWKDQAFKLEASMLDLRQDTPLETISKEDEGIEALPGSVKALADSLTGLLFKRATIAEIIITGNQRIGADTIKRAIKSAPGQVYLSHKIPEDIKSIYNLGYFEDIRADVDDGPDGKIITFNVKEKPTIRQVLITGNRVLEKEKLVENIDIQVGSILNLAKVKATMQAVLDLYKEKNYHNAEISFRVRMLASNQADLIFSVKEGEKLYIKEIALEGNSSYSDSQLKDVMKTSEKGTFSWLTSSGDLSLETLDDDIIRLREHYHSSGFIDATVEAPQIEYRENWIYIAIRINEGSQYRVGNVDITGELLKPKAELLSLLEINRLNFFNREIMQKDILALSDLYANEGFAYADIVPQLGQPEKGGRMDITYNISKGKQVYFESITIAGNKKTRDKVIRRELLINEDELYDGKKLKESVRNIYQLGHFNDVKVDTSKGSGDDRMNVSIGVEERSTNAFFFAGGYSEVDDAYGQLLFEERNLFGNGQDLRISALVGQRDVLYQLRFLEPWLFDMPLAAGFEIYNWEQDYDFYKTSQKGGRLRTGYRIGDDTWVFLGYKYEQDEIETATFLAPGTILFLSDSVVNSSVFAAIQYDAVNDRFMPTQGQRHAFSVEYAGLGGDVGFVKYIGEIGFYFPIYKKLVLHPHLEGGYIDDLSGFILPDYERFYIGGIDNLRGYDWRDISPKEINPFGYVSVVGGSKYAVLSLEFLLPVAEDSGVNLLAFYDAGNVYGDDDDFDIGNFRQSVGGGIRWFSPMGPIRLEYAYPLDTKPGEESGGRWEFVMGYAF